MGLPYGRQYTMEWPALHRGRGGRRVAGTDCVIYLPAPISLIRCSCCSHPARRVGRPSPGSRHLPPRSQMLVLQQPRPAGGTPL